MLRQPLQDFSILRSYLNSMLESASERIRIHRNKANDSCLADMFGVMDWSGDAIQAAADANVAIQVLSWMDDSTPLQQISDRVLCEALNRARNPKASTSQVSNIAAAAKTAAWAEVASVLFGT